jgi:hypothetical protein
VLVWPFWLGEEKLPLHENSVVPPWLIVSVYVVNVTSAIATRQLLFGHPACLGVTVGTAVVTSTPARPFFGLLIVWLPPAVTGTAGFWPGDSFPPGLVHVRPTAVPFADTVETTVSPPRPATWAVQRSCVRSFS